MLMVLVLILTIFEVDTIFTGDAAAHPGSHAVVLLAEFLNFPLQCVNLLLLFKNAFGGAEKIHNF